MPPIPPPLPTRPGSGFASPFWIALNSPLTLIVVVIGAIAFFYGLYASPKMTVALFGLWHIFGLMLGGLLIYFLPTGIALWRRHANWIAILIVNFFLGWTLVGWVVALAWSCLSGAR
jgi:hypothetical protein